MGKSPGNGLFSQTVSSLVSSALKCFTTVFGMGTGGSTTLGSPGLFSYNICRNGVQGIHWQSPVGGAIHQLGQLLTNTRNRSRVGLDSNEDADGSDHGGYRFGSFEGTDVRNC